MRAGELRIPMTYETPITTATAQNTLKITSWTPVFSTRGSVRTLTGRETLVAQQIKSTAEKVVTIRYPGASAAQIDARGRLTWTIGAVSHVFQITHFEHVDERLRELRIYGTELLQPTS